MAAVPSGANKPRLSFAKVAASASAPQGLGTTAVSQLVQQQPDMGATQGVVICDGGADQLGSGMQSSDRSNVPHLDGTKAPTVDHTKVQHRHEGKRTLLSGNPLTKDYHREPVSEANITKMTSSQRSIDPSSADGRSVVSTTTFTLDEKESLRPDDSASVKATDDEDGRTSTHASSRIGSDSGARAFSDQLREISSMGPPSRQPAAAARISPAVAPSGGVLYTPPLMPESSSVPGGVVVAPLTDSSLPFSPDEKLLEALNSVRDRVWVLKLEQDITDFVKDSAAQSFDVPQCNSFYRMLAHKMADYYLLGHTLDSSLSSVKLWKTPNCRIPPRLSTLTNPSTASSTPPPSAPQMKILRREGNEVLLGSRGGTGSRGDNDGDSSDEGKPKLPSTREEREARYEAARLRIMGSAKPSEDLSLPEKKDDSRSSSTTGKKKNRKQRSDSEDGFEARSAYSTYPNSGTPNTGVAANSQIYAPLQQPGGMSFDQTQSWLPSQSYGSEYQSAMATQAGPYAWYQQNYPGTTEQSQWKSQNGGAYDMPSHFHQGMSFQPPNMHNPYAIQPGNHTYGDGSVHSSPRQWPSQIQPSPQSSSPYQNVPPHQSMGPSSNPTYAYGLLPNQVHPSGKRQNLNHPIPGSFNRQQFNPQSQTFTPGQPSPPSMQTPGFVPYQSMPQGLQRQHSSQSQGSYSGPMYSANQMGNLPSAQGLTHPLPQPVFPQSSQLSNRQPYQPYGPPPRVNSTEPQSGISKYGGASLPAKPPPPMEGALAMSVNQVPPGLAHSNSPIHMLPSMVNFGNGGANASVGGHGRTPIRGGSTG